MKRGIGLELSRFFFEEVVAPVLKQNFPDLAYSAARVGLGSEVLGLDTAMSADHDYGPCVQLFVQADIFPVKAREVMAMLDLCLPSSFNGFSVRYPTATRPPGNEAQDMLGSDHGVELYTLASWRNRFLGPAFEGKLTLVDWLSFSEQIFLTATAGAVFRDDTGELTAFRDRLAYFPEDVWLFKIAAQWTRIGVERAFIGRTGDVGDELGSKIIAARMTQNIMRLALLLDRRYAPYAKWFGSAFSDLPCAGELTPKLLRVLGAPEWQEREAHLYEAVRFVAEYQIIRGIPGATAPLASSLHGRPFRFVDSVKIAENVKSQIANQKLRELPDFGGADQLLDGLVLAVPSWSSAATAGLFDHVGSASADVAS